MAVPKGFDSKDSKHEKIEGGKQSGGSTFDVLDLLGMPKDMKNNIKNAMTNVEHAVDGLKQLVGQAEKHEAMPAPADSRKTTTADNHHDFKRGTYLNATSHPHADHPLMARLVHNETPNQNPSHLSAFLLKRLHERQQQSNTDFPQQATQFAQPMQFEQQPRQFQQVPQESQGTQWQEANLSFRRTSADAVLNVARPLAAMAPGADLNPNLGADPEMLRRQGLPYTRSIDRDIDGVFDHIVRPIVTRQPEKFHSQMSHQQGRHADLPYGGFQQYAQPNYYRAENNYHQNQQHALPYGGFQTNVPYYRRSS